MTEKQTEIIARERIAFDKGWVGAARWAKRDDLLADLDSPAYLRERDEALLGVPAPGPDEIAKLKETIMDLQERVNILEGGA
jgi:hypothetical protein